MKHFIILLLSLVFLIPSSFGQKNKQHKKAREHKIVFQLITSDSTEHQSLIRQLNHMLDLEPQSKIEVVCHGPGLDILLKNKSTVLTDMDALYLKKVDFVGCEATMKRKKIERNELVDHCRTVPGGMMEIVYKQEEGWSYIKAGY
jgi:hypothetical protein